MSQYTNIQIDIRWILQHHLINHVYSVHVDT